MAISVFEGMRVMTRLILLLMFFYANAALAAPSLVNGSFTGPSANGAVPTGWTITSATPDTMDENNNTCI